MSETERVEFPDFREFERFSSLCRFCGQSKDSSFPIENLKELNINFASLLDLLELHSDFSKYFSNLICPECTQQITLISRFKMQCKLSESKLMEHLKIPIKEEEIKLEDIESENRLEAEDTDNTSDGEDSDYKPPQNTRTSKIVSLNECEVCRKVFQDSHNFEEHECEQKELKCLDCEEIFHDATLFRKHKRSHKKHKSDSNKNTECEICHKVRVIKKFGDEFTYIFCSLQVFPTYRGLSNHKLAHRRRDIEGFVPKKRPEAMCEHCGRHFQTPSGLIKHNQTKHLSTNQSYPCDECPKKFANMIALKSHKSNTHKIENSTCPICHKIYKNRMLLRLHSRFHDESKRIFKCEYCPEKAGFFTKSDLKKHIRSHFGEKPYSCNFSQCEKRYA